MTANPVLGLRAELCSAASGAVLNAGNLEEILAANYSQALGKIGQFSISVPAETINTATADYEQEIKLYRTNEGLVFRGLIKHLEIQEDAPGAHTLVISGLGIEGQLAKVGTKTGLTLNAVSLSSAVGSLLALATGWAAGALDTVPTAYTKFIRAQIWPALADVANVFGCYLRSDNVNKQVDIGVFGQNPNGTEFRSIQEMTPGLDASTRLFPIKAIKIIGDSGQLVNRIVPLGSTAGIGSTPGLSDFDISYATVTSPYAKVADIDPDGNTYYYIQDPDSIARFGLSEQTFRYNGIAPVGLSAIDFQNASNQLIQAAGADLLRMKTLNKSYDVTVANFIHYAPDGTPLVQVGDAIHVSYNGIVQDAGGMRRWLAVDTNLYVMDFTRTFGADGGDSWRFTLNTVPLELTNDGNVTRALLEQINARETAPLPYVLLNDSIRVDVHGMQIANPAGSAAAIWFNEALNDDPLGTRPWFAVVGGDGGDGHSFSGGFTAASPAGPTQATAEMALAASDSGTISAQWQIGLEAASISAFLSTYLYSDLGDAELQLYGMFLHFANLFADPPNPYDGSMWGRADLGGRLFHKENGIISELGSMPDPDVISIGSLQSIGGAIAGYGLTQETSTGAYPSANRAYYIPFTVTRAFTARLMFVANGGTVSGNIDVGIYDEAGTRLVSTGSTAQAGISQNQTFDIADTVLTPGLYFMAIAMDNITGRIAQFIGFNSASALTPQLVGVYMQATAFPLPATATFAAANVSAVPIMGMTQKTLV